MCSFSLRSETVLLVEIFFNCIYAIYKLLKLGMWHQHILDYSAWRRRGTGMQLDYNSLNPVTFLELIVHAEAIRMVCEVKYSHQLFGFPYSVRKIITHSHLNEVNAEPKLLQWSLLVLILFWRLAQTLPARGGFVDSRWTMNEDKVLCQPVEIEMSVQYMKKEKVTLLDFQSSVMQQIKL